jgi:hypothetical protein
MRAEEDMEEGLFQSLQNLSRIIRTLSIIGNSTNILPGTSRTLAAAHIPHTTSERVFLDHATELQVEYPRTTIQWLAHLILTRYVLVSKLGLVTGFPH